MPIDVQMPDGTIISGVPDNVTQADLLKRYQAYKPTPDSGNITGAVPDELGRYDVAKQPTSTETPEYQYEQPDTGFTGALKSSGQQIQADIARLAGKIGLKDINQAEREARQYEAEAKRVFRPTEKGWTEAPLTKLAETAGGSLPYMVAPIVAAPVAALALPEIGLAGGLIGAAELGAGAVGAAQFTGSNLSRQAAEGKSLEEASLLKAGAAAIPQAALDVFGLKMLPGLRQIFTKAGVDVSEKALEEVAKKGLLEQAGYYTLQTGKTMGAEGITEAGQQVLERMQAGLNIADPEARKEYFESLVGGAALGGAFAVPGHAAERLMAKKGEKLPEEPPVVKPPVPTEPTEPPPVPPAPPAQTVQPVEPVVPVGNVWEGIQNRDRSTPASIAQMNKIANTLDYDRVSLSKNYGEGAPVISGPATLPASQLGREDTITGSDGKKVKIQYGVVDAGDVLPSHNVDGTKNPEYSSPDYQGFRAITNGRVAGLQAAYRQGSADNYRNALTNDDLHGIDKSVIQGMKNPMLVRVMPQSELSKNIGDVSNTAAGLSFNMVEQAKNDTNRVDLSKVQFNDSGDVTPQTVRDFIKDMPDTERGNLIDKDGNPTKQAIERLNAAIFQQAYGNDKLTELGFQAQDEEARNIIRGLNVAASKAIRLGEAGDYDVRPLVNEAVEMAINARRNGLSLQDAAKQVDITTNPLANQIVQMFADNPRSAKAIGENLSNLFDNAYAEASKSGEDMFGEVPKRPVDQLIKDSFAKGKTPDLFIEEEKSTAPTKTGDEPQQFKSKKPMDQIAKDLENITEGSQLAQYLVDEAPNAASKAIAERVLFNIKAIEQSGVPVKIEVLKGSKRKRWFGSSLPVSVGKKIQYFKVQFNGLNAKGQAETHPGSKDARDGMPTSRTPTGTRYSTLMHELLHVISQVQLDALIKRNFKGPEKEIYNELRSIYNAVKKQIEQDRKNLPREQWHPLINQVGSYYNGSILKDIHELFVRALTEKDVQTYLSGVKMGKKSALTRLMEIFRKVLGLDPEYQSALDRIMIVSEKIFAQTPQDMKRLALTEGYDFPAIKGEAWYEREMPDRFGREIALGDFYKKMRGSYDEFNSPDEAYEAAYKDANPDEKAILRQLKKENFLGFDYPHQAIQAIIEEPENFELSKSLKAAISKAGNKAAGVTQSRKEEVGSTSNPAEGRNYKGEPVKAAWSFPEDQIKHWHKLSDDQIDEIIYKLQDKQIDTKRVQQFIEQQIGQIDENLNVYEKEQLYHGRTATGIREYLLNELLPAIKELKKLNLTAAELKEYLHNRHAKERNDKMNELNRLDPITGEERETPWELQDRASGISTDDAKKYMDNLDPAKKAALEKVASKFDDMVKETQRILVESGAETQDTIDAWNNTYDFYVPLFRLEEDFAKSGGMGATGASKGFGTRGGFSKRALGSEKEVQDILGNLIAQRERALIRAEKMKVGHALFGLALNNPNADLWLPVNPDAIKSREALIAELKGMGYENAEQIADNLMEEPKTRYLSKQRKIDPDTGLPTSDNEETVKLRIDNLKRFGPNVFPVRIDGKDRYIFFNQNNPQALRMVQSLLNLDADSLGQIEGMIGKATRWFASVNTQYNPIFGAVNLIRDVGGAMFNLTSTPIAGEQGKVSRGVFPAMRGILNVLRDERKGKTDTTGKWAKAFQEFRREGGQTGYRDSLIRTDEEKQIVEHEMEKLNDKPSVKKAFRSVMGALSDFNDMMENSVRLSAYVAARDKGFSPQKAAIIAKNLTVNFDKKGQLSARINAYYAFFNASVQGTARLAQTLKGPMGKKIIAGGIGLGTMQAVLLAMAGFREDEPPEFVKERNFVIPTPDGKYVTIPYPLGLHILPNIGRITTEFVLGGGKNAGKKVANLTGSFMDAFSPVGSSGLSIQSVLPTVLDPIAALESNKDAFGRPIYKEDRATNPTPGYMRSRESASEISKGLSYFLNLASGGGKYSKGFLSPTADELDYIAGQVTGGAGRELMKVEQAVKAGITGEELPAYRIPLAGRFYGETESKAAESQRFYSNITRMADYENEIKGRIKNKENVGEYLRDHPQARYWQMANNVENQINALNKQKKEFIERGLPRDRIQRIENQKQVIMKRFNDHISKFEE